MQGKILKWGNSHAIRIPLPILKELGLKENDDITIEEHNKKIIMYKNKKRTTEEIICEFEEKYGKGDYECKEEWSPNDIKGKELW